MRIFLPFCPPSRPFIPPLRSSYSFDDYALRPQNSGNGLPKRQHGEDIPRAVKHSPRVIHERDSEPATFDRIDFVANEPRLFTNRSTSRSHEKEPLLLRKGAFRFVEFFFSNFKSYTKGADEASAVSFVHSGMFLRKNVATDPDNRTPGSFRESERFADRSRRFRTVLSKRIR